MGQKVKLSSPWRDFLIWPKIGSKLPLDTRIVNNYLPEVNIEGKYAYLVHKWPRNKLPNMVLADFANMAHELL